jgi:hypothetical protein
MGNSGSYETLEFVAQQMQGTALASDMETGDVLYGYDLGRGVQQPNDRFFYGIRDTSYDENGLLKPDYELYTEKVFQASGFTEGNNEEDLTNSALSLISYGAINIHINDIVSTLETEGDLYSYAHDEWSEQDTSVVETTEYTIYSPIQSFNENYPKVDESSITTEEIEFEGTEGLRSRINRFPLINGVYRGPDQIDLSTYKIEYIPSEVTGLTTKYAGLIGMSSDAAANSLLIRGMIEDKYASMASDLHQTFISREYIGKKIKQKITFPPLNFGESFGAEASSTLVVNTTSTSEIP